MQVRPRAPPGASGGGAGASGINAGEEYIRQLAQQSAENHERRFRDDGTLSEMEATPGTYGHGAHNAGEEYMRQLASQSSGELAPAPPAPPAPTASDPAGTGAANLTPEQQARIAGMRAASAAASRADTPASRIVDGAEAARQRILAELKALNLETGDAPDESEMRQTSQSPQSITSLDDEIAALEAKLASRERASSPPPPTAPVPTSTSPTDEVELEQMRMGMIEMRMETERYANEVRKLQEKHEQLMRIIIEKYMPGL